MFYLLQNARLYNGVFLFFGILFFCVGTQLIKTNLNHTLIHIFDIPGESIFLQFPQGHNIIIDGGLGSYALEKINKKIPFWENTIDAIIISHPDQDHMEGFLPIIKKFFVKNIYLSGAEHESNLFSKFIDLAAEKRIPLHFINSNKDFKVNNTVFDVLYPKESLLGKHVSKTNNSSLVIKTQINKKNSILFTGDIEKSTENEIVKSPFRLYSTHIKIPHHGSISSSSSQFLRAVSAKKAVISAHSKNPFRHPHEKITDRLKKINISTLITKERGEITFSF